MGQLCVLGQAPVSLWAPASTFVNGGHKVCFKMTDNAILKGFENRDLDILQGGHSKSSYL